MSAERIIKGSLNTLKLSDPILYVDNETRGRSGHMGHPMVNLGGGKIMDFTSNVSAVRCDGHSGFGWMEYRISEDYGETFGDFNTVPYTMEVFLDGLNVALIEAAVACDDGSVVAICNINSQSESVCCSPHSIPTYIRTCDMGKTWEEAKPLGSFEGRVYCARYFEGKIYVMQFCNREVVGEKEDDLYRIFVSEDNGITFKEHCVIPFPSTKGRFYGTMQFDKDGRLLAYAYNQLCETELDVAVSPDGGKTWTETGTCYLAKKIRNPQIAVLDQQYILHGREAGSINSFVMYTSKDGLNWDEGHRIVGPLPAISFYSNNVIVTKDGKDKLLVQYSQTFNTTCCVNVYHMWVETV